MTPASQPDLGAALQELIQEFLQVLPEPLKRVMRLGAIPYAFTIPLLQRMAGNGENTQQAVKTLMEHQHFLKEGEGGWYYYTPVARQVLLSTWQHLDQLQEFKSANQVAQEYFDELVVQNIPPATYIFQREALYHRLLGNEESGMEFLAELFERACDQHQLGVAQDYCHRLEETLPQLTLQAAQHATYYQARLDFQFRRLNGLHERLERLYGDCGDNLLKARVSVLWAKVLMLRYEWATAADLLNDNLKTLKKMKSWRYAARSMLVLGDVYRDLVENSGGLQSDNPAQWGGFERFMHTLALAPYVFFSWLRRKTSLLPGWIYFSGNYQDWIHNYLLRQAGKWYRRAGRISKKMGDETAVLEAFFGQAKVAVQQGREKHAKRIYSRLAQLPGVASSRYRSAQVGEGLGQVALLSAKPIQATVELERALEVYRAFDDITSIAQAARSLGQAFTRMGAPDSAARAFLQSLRAFHSVSDHLPQTRVGMELEDLMDNQKLDQKVAAEIREALSGIPERQYLAQFPGKLLDRSRTLAYLVALPLSYVMLIIIGLATCFTLIMLETIAVGAIGHLTLPYILSLGLITLLPVPLAFWTVEIIYCLLGHIWIVLLGRRSLSQLGEQPDRITVTSDEIQIHRPGVSEPERLAWKDVREIISADYRVWQRPIALMSRQYVKGNNGVLILEGISDGYLHLRKVIRQKVTETVEFVRADLVLIANRWTILTALVALLHSVLLIAVGQGKITVIHPTTCEEKTLVLSVLLVFLIINMSVLFPPVMLWQIYAQRRFLVRETRYHPRVLGRFVLFAAALLLSLLSVFWLLISPSLKLGGEPTPSDECIPEQAWQGDNMSHYLDLPPIEIVDETFSERELLGMDF